MRQVINNVEAGRLTEELSRRGIAAHRRLRVVVETLEDGGLPMAAINASGGAFGWLQDEPDLYSDGDVVERYRG